jgi:hypothetical protein
MLWLWLSIELAVELLASWTVAVHACIALALPAWVAWPLCAFALVLCQWLGSERFGDARAQSWGEHRFAAWVALIGGLLGAVSLVLLTPSGDDFNFFHRALWQLGHLSEPFARGDTAFNAEGLAAISPLHLLTSWELGVAMAAHALGLDPLGVYHNGSVVISSLLLAALLALWLRELRFASGAALAGCVAGLLFYGADDPHLRSFAIAFRMLWVGKMVQWLLLFPAALLMALRYLRDPCRRNLWHPALCGVCAVGLSGTGVFLLPGLFAAASLGGLFLQRPDALWLVRCGLLNLASVYCIGVAALMLLGVLPQPADTRAWTESFPAQWTSNVMLVFGSWAGLVRAGVLAFVVPALVVPGRGGRLLLGFSVALVVVFLNPLAAPLWIDAVRAGSFWRVVLLVPQPLLFGAAIAALASALPSRRRAVGVAVACASLLILARLVDPPQERSMSHLFATKAPWELRFEPDSQRFVRSVASELEGRSLLAPPGLAPVAALLVPSLRLEAARFQDTRHVFANADRAAEGERRIQAWSWAGRCDAWPPGARAAAESLARGVDALILRDCASDSGAVGERSRLLAAQSRSWREVHRAHGFALWLAR